MVRKIAGKSPSCSIKHLNINNTEITEIPDIANSLGQTYSNNSSSNNYSTKFQAFRNHAENQHLKFKSNNLETYNNLFSLDELWDAISKSHDSAVGPDDIHYQMLKHLPLDAVNTLLETLNNIWFAGNFPPSWCTSILLISYLNLLKTLPIQITTVPLRWRAAYVKLWNVWLTIDLFGFLKEINS